MTAFRDTFVVVLLYMVNTDDSVSAAGRVVYHNLVFTQECLFLFVE